MTECHIYTIGHSNHTAEEFLGLLRMHDIELVVDVRSAPYSRYNPHFNKETLIALLQEEGIDYAFHGDSLGGRPNDPTCYTGEAVDYGKVREKEWFREGLEHVMREAKSRLVTLLCSEEDPLRCHRHHLIGQQLLEQGATVMHIRGNGTLEAAEKNREQLRLL